MKEINSWTNYNKKELGEIDRLSKNYIDFISENKTEREATSALISLAEKNGYINLDEIIKNGEKLEQGSKIYAVNMKKAIVMLNIGKDITRDGLNILGAHLDSPRLDTKQNPLYEKDEFAYLNTQYYGGIKKYQWVTIPLSIHGVIIKKDGSLVKVSIGENDDDPVLFISDLLIHLAQEQMKKPANEVIEGENLDIVVGTKPLNGEEKEAVKANILKLLKEKYGVDEDDFWSSELEIVPAGRAREAGLDRSLILGYGHDDRCCAYTSALAMMEVENPTKTACGLFVDKEEIGSVGATGMESKFFENVIAEVLDRMGIYSELNLKRTLRNSRMLSSDVSATFDPLYADKFDKPNAAQYGRGIVFNKYTGGRGKSSSNDANAEYLAKLRKIFNDNNVVFQSAELGRVDVGGGGTIAYILSLYGMEVVDSGIAVLSMHSPWEAISKADLYEAKKGYVAFLKDA